MFDLLTSFFEIFRTQPKNHGTRQSAREATGRRNNGYPACLHNETSTRTCSTTSNLCSSGDQGVKLAKKTLSGIGMEELYSSDCGLFHILVHILYICFLLSCAGDRGRTIFYVTTSGVAA